MNNKTTQLSGLTDDELEMDRVCDEIKATKESLLCVKILQKFVDKKISEYIDSISTPNVICSNERIYISSRPERVYDRDVDIDDDVYTIAQWNDAVNDGMIGNEDGSGYWMKDGKHCRDEVFNSNQLDATHVVWYNK
jgi:hypothetical protein